MTKQGRIIIVNRDTYTQVPINNSGFTIVDLKSGEIIESLTTDEAGKATSGPLDMGTSYIIQQNMVMQPYELDRNEIPVKIDQEILEITTTNHISLGNEISRETSVGNADHTNVFIPVKSLMQYPELPNGCEVTSLTSVLNYYGYDVTKTKMADKYLPKAPFEKKNGKIYGADPYKAYAGNPREQRGFFVPIVEAANQFLKEIEGEKVAKDLSGSNREETLEQLNKGNPIVIWVTLDLSKPKIGHSWYIDGTEELFNAPVNLQENSNFDVVNHCNEEYQ
ncbi:C39 family peptidase [Cytobacillus praedii]|uniref:Peptidase C39-like domain-containing protein n=1 Tax=Cytobacillus praedii TaxID=1742358 RepID=A0A4R1ARW4_9BACI|nr:C39 family peptidase [Cytobacillus praedii]TCJ02304.1 hypothetical protein E0Y62_19895 [Cytobacillus praedii]